MHEDDLPLRPPGDDVAKDAIRATQMLVEGSGWIFRRQDGTDDYGIDAELEVTSGGGLRAVTGRTAKAQIRGRSRLIWRAGSAVHPVRRSAFNLWRALGRPVFLFLWDADRQAVHWATPTSVHPAPDEASVSIPVLQANVLQRGLAGVNEVMDLWDSAGTPADLTNAQWAHTDYELLREEAEGPYWLDAGPEITERLRRFSAHVDGLALAMGLARRPLRSIAEWRKIDALLRPDDADMSLHYGTLSIAVGEAGVRYVELLLELRRRLDDGDATIRDYRISESLQWLRYAQLDVGAARDDATWARQRLALLEATET